MKKAFIIGAIMSAIGLMAACGGNAKSDGEAMGKKICECTKLANDGKIEEATKCGEEAEKIEYAKRDERDEGAGIVSEAPPA